MLSKVETRTDQGSLFSLELADADSGYIVAGIDGLDPVKATLVSSSFAAVDGAQYQNARRETRNIIIKLELDPDPAAGDTVRSLRKKLYGFFMPKKHVSMRFIEDDGFSVDIDGRVESCESPLFAQVPTVVISIVCFDPDFVDPTLKTVSGMLTSDVDSTLVNYEGSVENGFVVTININRTVTEFTIYLQPPNDQIQQMNFAAPLVAGDVLTISTVYGNKGATLNTAGVVNSILYGISPESKWFELQPGVNSLRFYAVGAGIPASIQYVAKYGGL
jgi:hypothetical protein